MKKLIPFFVLGTIAAANAQTVTIDQSDFPQAGDSFSFGTDLDVTDLTIDLGTTGSGQTFDFSMLNTDSLFTVGFYDPATVTSGSDFPTADMAVDQSQAYGFVQVNAGSVDVIGLGGDLGPQLGSPVPLVLSIPATNPWTIFTFPSSLGTSFTDTAVFDQRELSAGLLPAQVGLVWQPAPDSVRIKRTVYIESSMDAEGTLTNVLGETHHVLRMNVVETNVDSLWGWTASGGWELPPALVQGFIGIPGTSTTYRTRYLSQEIGYYVVEFETDQSGTPLNATFISDQTQCCTGVEDIVAAGQAVMYPNPTNGTIRVRTGGDIYLLHIMDMSGKLLQMERLTIDNQTVDVSNLASGLYVYQMVDESGKIAHTGRLSCIK
ncbi:MAG: T9SS type A sorting domain-containing protein [Flavobacteriales bacterium]|nr:T9SS type A sorting domain-containing protein [Flavobacteriales bacterium]